MSTRLTVDGRAIEVEEVLHRGWAGIVYRDPRTNQLYLNTLEWIGGAYIDRVRAISRDEFAAFRDAPPE